MSIFKHTWNQFFDNPKFQVFRKKLFQIKLSWCLFFVSEISFAIQVIYEATVVTGDVQNAGTDTNIFLMVFGANGSSEEILLQKNEDRCGIYQPLCSIEAK